jgi:hypothetical protein
MTRFFPYLAVLALSLVCAAPARSQDAKKPWYADDSKKVWSEADIRAMIREEVIAAVREALAEVKTKPAAPKLTYDDAKAAAIRDGKPLLAFVRMAVVDVPGCVCVDVPGGFADDKGESYVMLGKPDGNGDINRAGFFHGPPTIEAVRAALTLPKVGKPAGAICKGGCSAACGCPSVRGTGACNCAAPHRIYAPRSEAEPRTPPVLMACASGH